MNKPVESTCHRANVRVMHGLGGIVAFECCACEQPCTVQPVGSKRGWIACEVCGGRGKHTGGRLHGYLCHSCDGKGGHWPDTVETEGAGTDDYIIHLHTPNSPPCNA